MNSSINNKMMTNNTMVSSTNNTNKVSIGESIKSKMNIASNNIINNNNNIINYNRNNNQNAINSVGSSRMMMKQSIKGVKQSIGHDSDMDFDLELD